MFVFLFYWSCFCCYCQTKETKSVFSFCFSSQTIFSFFQFFFFFLNHNLARNYFLIWINKKSHHISRVKDSKRKKKKSSRKSKMQFQEKEKIVGINSVAQADADSDIRGGVGGFEVPNETRKFKIDYYITTTDRPRGFQVKG